MSSFTNVGFYLFPNLWQVKINGSWRIIDETGNFISDLFFDDAVDFDNFDHCGIRVGDKWGFIDHNLKWVIKPIFQKIGLFDCDGECNIGLLNKMGIQIGEYGSWNYLGWPY